jgi:spore germination protein YaaH
MLLLLFAAVVSSWKASAAEEIISGSYIYFGGPGAYSSAVEETKDSLSEVLPSYMNLDENGELKLTSVLSESFIDEMHEKGIRVIPFLSNHWDRDSGAAALENRRELALKVAEAVKDYGLDGVNIDLENLTFVHRTAYVHFIRLLREALEPGKTLSVAVAANPYGTNTGRWQARALPKARLNTLLRGCLLTSLC